MENNARPFPPVRRRRRRRSNARAIALLLAIVLTFGVAVGGTIAWLTDETEDVVNTFTVGNIDIDLDETTGDTYKMVPGNTITKDPFVTVEKGSEACWLFVKVEKSTNFENFMTYDMADGWTLVEGQTNVYWREVADLTAATEDSVFPVLKDNKVTVLDTVTKSMMDAIENGEATEPTLTFTAYAIQKANFTTPEAAWTEINK